MNEIRLSGTPASSGMAVGELLVRRPVVADSEQQSGSLDADRQDLTSALEKARADIAALIASLDDTAAEIMEFQQALLEDDDFLKPVFAKIEAGVPVRQAWSDVLATEIGHYLAGGDEYMSARADDLKDLRNRVLRLLSNGQIADITQTVNGNHHIIALEEITPSEFLELNMSTISGIAVINGSPISHVSILARARGVPMIVGCDPKLLSLEAGAVTILDSETGSLVYNATERSLAEFLAKKEELEVLRKKAEADAERPAVTACGQTVTIYANVDDPAVLDSTPVFRFDGIGLVRTEFLFEGRELPTEEEQFGVYCSILKWANGRPVTIRALDAGGDKPIPGVTLAGETNPFLGVRGYRLLRLNRDLFRAQLRALARAAAHGRLKVMIPMVTVPLEMAEFRSQMAAIVDELNSRGIECAMPPLGMMVEIPAAALEAQSFEADFFSIGSNDLIQYTTACARDNARLNSLASGANPGVRRLISMVVEAARERDIEVSVCGDMASDPALIPFLLEAGVRALSVSVGQIALAKHAVRQWHSESKAG